jgi:Mg-chelatase subunit ChlD
LFFSGACCVFSSSGHALEGTAVFHAGISAARSQQPVLHVEVDLLDSSDSMNPNGRPGSAQEVAAQFMRTARSGDEISAMDFTDQMGPFQRLTREELLNPSGIPLSPPPSGGSALYDAVASALCHLRASKNPRQAVIVVTDGVDEYSRITLEQLMGLVRSSRAQLFMIGLERNIGVRGLAAETR